MQHPDLVLDNQSKKVEFLVYDLNEEKRQGRLDQFQRLVRHDLRDVKSNVRIKTTSSVSEFHYLNTVFGHASEGHGMFHTDIQGEKVPIIYRNVSLDDVILAVEKNPELVKANSQEEINLINRWISDRVDTLQHLKYLESLDPEERVKQQYNPSIEDSKMMIKSSRSKDNPSQLRPLAGAHFFEWESIADINTTLIGFYLGSMMDSAEWRKITENMIQAGELGISDPEYKIHKGSTFAVNIKTMFNYGLSIDDFANSKYKEKLRLEGATPEEIVHELSKRRIISSSFKTRNNRKHDLAYVELEKGYGISDDAAFITACLMFGLPAGYGLLLADAIDTFDKYSTFIYKKGQDELAGENLANKYLKSMGEPIISKEDLKRIVPSFIYLSLIDKNSEEGGIFPSCSQRRFWEDLGGMTTVESHVEFIRYLRKERYGPPSSNRFGYHGVKSDRFYNAYLAKLDKFIRQNIFETEYNLFSRLDNAKVHHTVSNTISVSRNGNG